MFRTVRNTVLALAFLASTVAAQSGDGARVGLGVALNPIALGEFDGDLGVLPLGLGNFTVPIRVGDRLRLEPEFGILRAHSEFSGSGFSGESQQTILRYGLGVHFLRTGTDNFRTYIGPRVGFIRHSNRQESSGSAANETKRTDHYLGVAVGGEYWFTPHFSLGAEVQVNRVGLGDEESTNQPPPSGSFSSSFIANNGVIAVRFYL
jgi:hypothetical protein